MRIPQGWPQAFEFGCQSAACSPPNKKGTGGTGGSIKGQTKPVWANSEARGIKLAQQISPRIVKTKSIPNVSDERLLDSLRKTHEAIHVKDAIYAWSQTRRSMIEMGRRGIKIRDELTKRGVRTGIDCRFCGNQPKLDQPDVNAIREEWERVAHNSPNVFQVKAPKKLYHGSSHPLEVGMRVEPRPSNTGLGAFAAADIHHAVGFALNFGDMERMVEVRPLDDRPIFMRQLSDGSSEYISPEGYEVVRVVNPSDVGAESWGRWWYEKRR